MPPHTRLSRLLLTATLRAMRLLLLALALGIVTAGLAAAGFSGRPAAQPVHAASPACPAPADPVAIPDALPVNPRALPLPSVSARSFAVIDGASGELLYGNNEHLRLPPASTTKIVTALVTLRHQADLDQVVGIDVDSRRMAGSSVMGLQPGMMLSVRDLLYGLMLPSGNDAAIALAQHVGGSVPTFVAMMNEEVARLGLADTHFTNPHGLDSFGHYSSAFDLAMLARAAMSDARFAQIVSAQRYRVASTGWDLYNGNTLLATYPGTDGVKIGWTDDAAETSVVSAVRDGHRVFVAVLGSKDRAADARALLDWAFTNYSWVHFNPPLVRALSLTSQLLPVRASLFALTGVCLGATPGAVPPPPPLPARPNPEVLGPIQSRE